MQIRKEIEIVCRYVSVRILILYLLSYSNLMWFEFKIKFNQQLYLKFTSVIGEQQNSI